MEDIRLIEDHMKIADINFSYGTPRASNTEYKGSSQFGCSSKTPIGRVFILIPLYIYYFNIMIIFTLYYNYFMYYNNINLTIFSKYNT